MLGKALVILVRTERPHLRPRVLFGWAALNSLFSSDLATEMDECNTGIRQATTDISTSLEKLSNDHRNPEAKQSILEAGKAIMKYMVRLLQLNDLFEITVLLKQVRSTFVMKSPTPSLNLSLHPPNL